MLIKKEGISTMSGSRQDYRKKKKKKNWKKYILLPLLILMLGALSYSGYLYYKANDVVKDSYVELDRDKDKDKDNSAVENVSILIAGVDTGGNRGETLGIRTDALMVATFNKDTKSVKLLSIPRDTYTYIPRKGYNDKINHAYGAGGIESSIETVEKLLDIPIDYYVQLNFNAFIEIVDALDGIYVDVPITFTEQDSNDKAGAIHLEKGYQLLDGEQALALARTRKIDNDIERGKRQQLIVAAIANRALSSASIFKYADVLDAVGNNLTTNLSFSEMTSFIKYFSNSNGLDIDSLTLDGFDSYKKGIYYYELDEDQLYTIQQTLKAHLGLIDAPSLDTTDEDDTTNN